VGVDRQRFDELAAAENFRQFGRGSAGLEQPLQLGHDVAVCEAAGLEGTQNLGECRSRRGRLSSHQRSQPPPPRPCGGDWGEARFYLRRVSWKPDITPNSLRSAKCRRPPSDSHEIQHRCCASATTTAGRPRRHAKPGHSKAVIRHSDSTLSPARYRCHLGVAYVCRAVSGLLRTILFAPLLPRAAAHLFQA
jgi:hypothetical protein